jgi:hypothetical protein
MTPLAEAVMSAYWIVILLIVSAVTVAEVRRLRVPRGEKVRRRIAELEQELGFPSLD